MPRNDFSAPIRRGRPRGKVRETKTVYLRLPNEMVEAIHFRARTKQWTINHWVETVLQNALGGRTTLRDRSRRGRVVERLPAAIVGDAFDR